MSQSERSVIEYYKKPESRLGYRLLLGGTKHFGYYPERAGLISTSQALRNMEDQLGHYLDLAPGSVVLDAGCGEGAVAMRLARMFGLHVEGIDLLDFNIARAQKKATRLGLAQAVHFQVGSYAKLPFPDTHFDGAYTMETLVHAVDHRVALREFYRVLKPDGRLVLFEYSMPPHERLSQEQANIFDKINMRSAMFSFPKFTHGSFPSILDAAGFKCHDVVDISERIMPMVRLFAVLSWGPYELAKLAHIEHRFINAMAGYELFKYRNLLRYNIITASKK